MPDQEMTDRLRSLLQMNHDAVSAYEQALEEIDLETIREALSRFRDEHNRHIAELSAMVAELGGVPPAHEPDAKGWASGKLTAILSLSGTEDALKVMQTNEKVITKAYNDACSWELTPGAVAAIERNRREEQRHLRYIREALAERAWDQPAWQAEPEEHRLRPGRRRKPREQAAADVISADLKKTKIRAGEQVNR